jgi:alpha-tubulin suppressor-like RCC1 family protein
VKDEVWCFGSNLFGQIGMNKVSYNQSIPFCLSRYLHTRFISVAPGHSHVVGISANNKLYCWGETEYGSLGVIIETDKYILKPQKIKKAKMID